MGGDEECRLAFPASSCITPSCPLSNAWCTLFPFLFSSPLHPSLSSGWAIQHWSARCPCFLHTVHVRMGCFLPWAIERAAAVEVSATWCFRSSLWKAVDMVVWLRILIRRSVEVNAPYSAWLSPVIAAWMPTSSMMSWTISMLGVSAMRSL